MNASNSSMTYCGRGWFSDSRAWTKLSKCSFTILKQGVSSGRRLWYFVGFCACSAIHVTKHCREQSSSDLRCQRMISQDLIFLLMNRRSRRDNVSEHFDRFCRRESEMIRILFLARHFYWNDGRLFSRLFQNASPLRAPFCPKIHAAML